MEHSHYAEKRVGKAKCCIKTWPGQNAPAKEGDVSDCETCREVERLSDIIAKEEKRTAECQKEIGRLRGIVRRLCDARKTLEETDHNRLFESWADFDDDESPVSVAKIIDDEGLAPVDSVSFMAYCAGFQKAANIFKEV